MISALVISLARSGDRRARIGAALSELAIPHEFLEAVDGRALDLHAHPGYAGRLRRLTAGKDLSPGEFGCLLSHRAALERIAAGSVPVLVLEDDARISPDLPQVLVALEGRKWDMVRFLARDKTRRESRDVAALLKDRALARVWGTPGGAYAYVVTPQGAARLLPFFRRNWQPADMPLGQTWRTGLDVYAVMPSPVSADEETLSTIGDTRFAEGVFLDGWERLAFPVTRGAFKLWENAGKFFAWRRDSLKRI